ncbi:MAG: hypothetical protein KJ555_08335 [Proteobacteria bacterium]|nr:hypothetical protein [Pseudomonadota bacterium]
MNKIPYCILLSVTAFIASGCGSVHVVPPEAMGPDVYRISAWGTSKKIIHETVKSANERCAQENKQYLFVKNIFQYGSNLGIDMVTYELFFTCVETGDPRIKERKSPLSPVDEKGQEPTLQKIFPKRDQEQVKPKPLPDQGAGPVPDKVVPEKEKPPVQEQASPAAEPAKDMPAISPVQEEVPPSEKQEAAPKVSEEQLRKGNPGMGEPEDLRKDGSALGDEAGKNIPVIEEILRK